MDIGLQLHASEQRFFDNHGGLSCRDALSAGLATLPVPRDTRLTMALLRAIESITRSNTAAVSAPQRREPDVKVLLVE
ncbi:hypothetical protein Poly21_50740 [Allorhodopirellula heiligendammensis]|uniref:Uncharacterized protein n=1 Tax=Allorhodopirellula heiligendammensis TaxID=2714739 RepID=A0A5C6BD06_9BACT|nr:hypothetical protein Poly21_50740 [Allorhodopirellula heiligendammensis]